MQFSDYAPYLSIVVNVFAIFFGYFIGVRKFKTEYFYSNLKDSLSLILSPMFHEIKEIRDIENSYQRDIKLRDFFTKYSSSKTVIYKIGNMFLLNWYYEMEELYKDYCKLRDDKSWSEFWIKFDRFYIMIKDYYLNTFSTLYIEHTWMLKLNTTGFTYRFLNELARFLYEYFELLIALGGIMAVVILSDRLSNTNLFSNDFINLYLLVYVFIFMIFAITIVLASNYLSFINMQKPKSKFKVIIEKRFPKIFKWWDRFQKPTLDDKNINIPQR